MTNDTWRSHRSFTSLRLFRMTVWSIPEERDTEVQKAIFWGTDEEEDTAREKLVEDIKSGDANAKIRRITISKAD